MTAQTCPKGHESSEADFCSVCGSKLEPASAAPGACPDCGAARDRSGAVFCEGCGYNFNTSAHGLPKSEVHPWQILIEVNPSLRSPESPEPPAGFAPVAIPLSKSANLIGRLSEKRGVFPEIDLTLDEAVSHRHALLNISPEGQLTVRDIGSSNGTMLNGAELKPLEDIPLNAGDTLTLGHWTRLRVR